MYRRGQTKELPTFNEGCFSKSCIRKSELDSDTPVTRLDRWDPVRDHGRVARPCQEGKTEVPGTEVFGRQERDYKRDSGGERIGPTNFC